MKINVAHYNKMYDALKAIAKDYQTPEQLKKNSKGQWGLDYEESLEMAYENIQQLAKDATKNVRRCPTLKTVEIGQPPSIKPASI